MTKSCTAFLTVFLLLSSVATQAGFKGKLTFSQADKDQHKAEILTITDEAALCAEEALEYHTSFFRKYGVSPYYGIRSPYGRLTQAQRVKFMRNLGLPIKLAAEIKPFSPMGLSLRCLKRGFERAGQEEFWDQIEKFTRANGVNGLALQHALQQIGWKVIYWNPSTNDNKAWDAEEKERNPENSDRFWGYHHFRWVTIQKESKYYFVHVDNSDYLVNFNQRTPRSFRGIPYFVGTAHTGYYTFTGSYGQVIENSYGRNITDADTMTSSYFNPLKKSGDPHSNFRTGLIAVPPGYENGAEPNEPAVDYEWF
jgi:hypothetical protein